MNLDNHRPRFAGTSSPGAKFWRRSLAILGAFALVAGATACSTDTGDAGAEDDPHSGELTFWFWAEPDVSGSTAWMEGAIKEYEALYPDVKINLVTQAAQTLQASFATAALAGEGPDIAMQWATLPVLTPVWQGAVEPLTGLIPEEEMSHWLNTPENMSDGKVWAMPWYLLGTPFVWNKELFAQAGLDPEKPPTNKEEFLEVCAALKAAGITPITSGMKDAALGSWYQLLFGTHNLDSVDELKDVYAGNADFTDRKYSEYLYFIEELLDKGYFPDDVSSIDAVQSWEEFQQGETAMNWVGDGNAAAMLQTELGDKLGFAKSPSMGDGALADYYTTTQSISAFITSWSPHKNAAAEFMIWLHQPEQLNSFYEATGAFPADDRFDASLITDPRMRELYELNALPNQLWAQNYAPPQVDSMGLRTVTQALFARSITAEEAAQQIADVIKNWQIQQPDEFEAYKAWADNS